ncbi:laccase 1 [Pterulicium gracile]|uniref:Laccase 1 n=1 Tax=Pterulicium gracile TaxID=1884261 RepID=A0A5C3QMW7_9AGAR|nr:laccase 1 [Pterula gracilis]
MHPTSVAHYFAILAACLPVTLAAIGPVTSLRVFNADVNPDGYRRKAATAGGAVTGPLIVGQKGDKFRINLINQLSEASMWKSTSIHWHGFFMKGTQWADGPAFVSQCPIAKDNSFLYEFNAGEQAGTFWYHSHLQAQYCDGLRGPMVVYNPRDPHRRLYDVDNEGTVITLADWYHVPSRRNAKIPEFDSTLINGLGRYYKNKQKTPLAVITVERGKRYRMRLVSITCDPNYTFQVDKHTDLTVIEVDGVDHKPIVVDSIQIFAGQRYSFILNANQKIDNYWIRANPNYHITGFENGINSAILRYRGALDRDPTTSQDKIRNPLKEQNLIPLDNTPAPGKPVPGGADINIDLRFSYPTSPGDTFYINGKSFKSPDLAVLLQILNGNRDVLSYVPEGLVVPLARNKVVELTFNGGVDHGPHPIHLHGHTFHVVRSAGTSNYNFKNPPIRDVVSAGNSGDRVTIRFVTDNPGPWILHCHIDWHLVTGFEMLFVEDLPNIPTTIQGPPDAWKKLCPIYHALDHSDL